MKLLHATVKKQVDFLLKVNFYSAIITTLKTCYLCRSEPARDGPENAAGCQVPSVIVGVHREQARSYSGSEFQRGSLGRHFNALLPARADQLYLNFLGGREAGENIRQVQ